MKKKQVNREDKVPVVLAFRMMQSVYVPLIKFTKDMLERGYFEYRILVVKFIDDATEKLKIKDITWFFECNYSFTINNVSKSIFTLYNLYHKKVGDNYFLAMIKLLESTKRDLPTQ